MAKNKRSTSGKGSARKKAGNKTGTKHGAAARRAAAVPPPAPSKTPDWFTHFFSESKVEAPEPYERGPLFTRLELVAFAVALLVSLVVYYLKLPPSVTLEDAGELAVASDHLGVPHPPGYPIWTMLTWFFQWVMDFSSYNGNPNPAYPVAFASAVFAAISNGVLAMIIVRSGRHMVQVITTPQPSMIHKFNWAWVLGGFAAMLVIYFGFRLHWFLGALPVALAVAVLGAWFFVCYTLKFNLLGLPLDRIVSFVYGMVPAFALAMAHWTGNNPAMAISLLALAAIPLFDLLLTQLQKRDDLISEATTETLCLFAGIAGALLFAFTPIQFSQAVIVEVYTLNTLFMTLITLLTYIWLCRPDKDWILYLTAFLFGLGMTNHQALLFIMPFLLVAIGARDRELFGRAVAFCCAGFGVYAAIKWMGASKELQQLINTRSLPDSIAQKKGEIGQYMKYCLIGIILPVSYYGARVRLVSLGTIVALFIGSIIAIYGFFFLYNSIFLSDNIAVNIALTVVGLAIFFSPLVFLHLRPAAFKYWAKLYGMFCLLGLGIGFLLYMPVASEQNPGMNWGYARTWNGFKHAVGRGQYEAISPKDNVIASLNRLTEKKAKKGNTYADKLRAMKDAKATLDKPEHDILNAEIVLAEAKQTLDDRVDLRDVDGRIAGREAIADAEAALAALPPGDAAKLAAYRKAKTEYDASHKAKFYFFYQMGAFFLSPKYEHVFSMVRQFTPWLALLSLVPLLLFFKMDNQVRGWLVAGLVALFFTTVVFMLAQYPQLNNQDLFIKRVQYIQAHAVFAMFVSYGFIMLVTVVLAVLRFLRLPHAVPLALTVAAGGAAAVLWPWQQVYIDNHDVKHKRDVGSSALDGQDFGWQFGFYQLRGANGIMLDMAHQAGFEEFRLDRRALDYMAWSQLKPGNLAALETLRGDENLDRRAFESRVLKALPDPHWKEKRLVREAALLSAWRQRPPDVAFNELAFEHLERGGTNLNLEALRPLVENVVRPENELRDLVAGKVPGISSNDLEAVLEAAHVGERFERRHEVLFNQFALDGMDTNAVSATNMALLQHCVDPWVMPEEEFVEKLRKVLDDPTEEEVATVVDVAKEFYHDIPDFDPEYPREMERDAIFYGGTDPGRFVPTYMIYSAKVREDVMLITQNALADGTYMNIMRDLYGDQIWMPSTKDSNQAFADYDFRVSTGREKAGAAISMEAGRMQVQGVQGVMKINAILCKYQHDKCKDQHAFYVEESYQIPWMFEYMKPHGLILEIHPEPTFMTREELEDDMNFWKWYTWKLTTQPEFKRDVIAQKTFSKLRGAIAGLYQKKAPQMTLEGAQALGCETVDEAKDVLYDAAYTAFEESVLLFPQSPEANSRFSTLLIDRRRYDEVVTLMNKVLKLDPENGNARKFIQSANSLKRIHTQVQNLEKQLASGRVLDPVSAYNMLGAYCNMGEWERVKTESRRVADANHPKIGADELKRAIDVLNQWSRWEEVKYVADKAITKYPKDWRFHIEKAAVAQREIPDEPAEANGEGIQRAMKHLQTALEVDFDPAFKYLTTKVWNSDLRKQEMPAVFRFGYLWRTRVDQNRRSFSYLKGMMTQMQQKRLQQQNPGGRPGVPGLPFGPGGGGGGRPGLPFQR